jgi:NAD(P)-dependent dehydrogenase (short-subunit alcohol dehydrogenase family)
VITAGEGAMGDFRELPVDQAQTAFDSKFWGQYMTVKAALPYLNKEGSISLTSGVHSKRPAKGASTLAAINSALEGLMRDWRLTLHRFG